MLIFQSAKDPKFLNIAYVGLLKFAKFDFFHYRRSFELQCQELWWAIRIGGPPRGLIVGTVDENISEIWIVKSNCKNTHSIWQRQLRSWQQLRNATLQTLWAGRASPIHMNIRYVRAILNTYAFHNTHMHIITMQIRCECVNSSKYLCMCVRLYS